MKEEKKGKASLVEATETQVEKKRNKESGY